MALNKNRKVEGNTKGISDFWLNQTALLYDFTLLKHQLVSEEMATHMAELTTQIGNEIAVYVDRNGRVELVRIGDKHTVGLEAIKKREAVNRLSGYRLIHTHPNAYGKLSDADLSSLTLLNFDAMVAIGVVAEKGHEFAGKITNVGLAWGVLGDEEVEPMLLPNLATALEIDFIQNINHIEKMAQNISTMHENAESAKRALLVTISGADSDKRVKLNLRELTELAESAGVVVVGTMIQKRSTPEGATYIGKGKVDEIRMFCQTEEVDMLIFDNELSPMQIRNLEVLTGKAIIDRSMLILDIFAQRAQSNEGKLQVELAQLKYMLPRLVGQGDILSRLGGGIGTRGPGETKLEMDKRIIRKKIDDLEDRLANVLKTRKLHQNRRKGQEIPIVALVGYTNAGKSTILNALTGSEVLAKDMLFATLDTATRKLKLPTGRTVLITDTVGFVRKLPHHLIAAFRATLEEVVEADLLLHVMDSSSDEAREQAQAVQEVLEYLKCQDKVTIDVFNKVDMVETEEEHEILDALITKSTNSIKMSAKNPEDIERLLAEITDKLPITDHQIEVVIPYAKGQILSTIHNEGKVQSEDYEAEGTKITATVPHALYQFLVKEGIVPAPPTEDEF